eukprot:1161037-Pelagomonas_calceolata.AAC.3
MAGLSCKFMAGDSEAQKYGWSNVKSRINVQFICSTDADEAPRGEGEQAETSNGPRGRGKTSRCVRACVLVCVCVRSRAFMCVELNKAIL